MANEPSDIDAKLKEIRRRHVLATTKKRAGTFAQAKQQGIARGELIRTDIPWLLDRIAELEAELYAATTVLEIEKGGGDE